MTSTRMKNVNRNLIFEIFSKIASFLLVFLSRSIFIRFLGEDYLGVNGYYTNVLQLLNLSELGLANVAMFSLYKPLADNDRERIKSLMAYYRKLYTGIALFILIVGLALTPWIEKLIKVQNEIPHLKFYYVLVLLNVVASYLFIDRNQILNASQNQYIVNTSSVIFTFIVQILQIAVLTIRRDYALFLIAQIVCTAGNMIYNSYRANKLFPYLKDKNVQKVDDETKKSIYRDIRSMSPYKIGDGILNYSDNVFITMLINTTTIAFYANYISLQNVLTTMGSVVYNAIFSTIGDFNVTSSEEQKKKLFDLILFGYTWIAMFFATGFNCMASDIVRIWLGEKFVISDLVVAGMTLNIFMIIFVCPINVYRTTTSTFRKTKGIMLYAAALNLVFSYVLGKHFGLTGIVFATSLAKLCTSFWLEPKVLYQEIFPNFKVTEYFVKLISAGVLVIISAVIVNWIGSFLSFGAFVNLVIKMFICCIVPNFIYWFVYRNSSDMKSIMYQVKSRLHWKG